MIVADYVDILDVVAVKTEHATHWAVVSNFYFYVDGLRKNPSYLDRSIKFIDV